MLQVRVPVRVRPAESAGLHPRGAARHGGPPAHRQEGGRALTRPRPRQYPHPPTPAAQYHCYRNEREILMSC